MKAILFIRKPILIQKECSLRKVDIIHSISLMKKEMQPWISIHFLKTLKTVKKIAQIKYKRRILIKSKNWDNFLQLKKKIKKLKALNCKKRHNSLLIQIKTIKKMKMANFLTWIRKSTPNRDLCQTNSCKIKVGNKLKATLNH